MGKLKLKVFDRVLTIDGFQGVVMKFSPTGSVLVQVEKSDDGASIPVVQKWYLPLELTPRRPYTEARSF